MSKKNALILGSASPRRTEILTQMGVPHIVIPSNAEEIIEEKWTPEQTVCKLSEQKALSVSLKHPEQYVLGSDTIVYHNGKTLVKPKNLDIARQGLKRLQGSHHEVYSGVALFKNGQFLSSKYQCTKVYFRELSDNEIEDYLNTREYTDKAGGYGIQGMGCRLVKKIEGCYFNVVGLPINATIELLKLMENND
jgi:septum formation protein